tara:strand:- start:1016 stop:1963 length:948 start_codon:yes stop_codon:yes gene_type:complete
MARRYIGGVSGSSFFKQLNNPGDYTTEEFIFGDITVPKGTYIGVGAVNDELRSLAYKGDKDGLAGEDDPKYLSAQALLGELREKYNWYDLNESKTNYGYENPESFIQDTQPYFKENFGPSRIDDGNKRNKIQLSRDDYKDWYLKEMDARGETIDTRVKYSADGEVTATIGFIPDYIEQPEPLDKIEPKKASEIDVEEPEINMQPAPEVQGGVGSKKIDEFMSRLDTAKVYESIPDKFSDKAAKNVRGRKKITTQYVFSDDNPFKPDGRYFASKANTKGKRKTSGNLNKAREWERKNGLGIQKDIVGYIPNLQFGG